MKGGGGFETATEIILEIRFGEGGEDSKIFVRELLAAYLKYAASLGLATELLHEAEGHVIVQITGQNVWQYFKHETGGHCCQRVPPTETRGRRHTSMVSVGVLPIKADVWVPLREEELEVITQCGHGKGGQHQNKTASAVRIKHLPTGLTVFINGRDQHANKREAMKIITARVRDKHQTEADKDYAEYRKKTLGDGGRGAKVRTYNFIDSFVKDHRNNVRVNNIQAVMKGDLEKFYSIKLD